MITSTTNQQVKYIVQLQKKRSLRKKDGVFVVEGIKMAMEIPQGARKKVYLSERFYKEQSSEPKIREWLASCDYEIMADHVFDTCAETQTPQGVLAIAKQSVYEESMFCKGEARTLYLILDGIQDPGNLGTILRTAEAVGASGVVMSADTVDLYNPKVVRSTMGAIFRVPFFYSEDIVALIKRQKQAGVTVFATALEDSVDYARCDFTGPISIVIGNEANGIRPVTKEAASQTIHIPMLGQLESLNAAVATAIVSYEAFRQRRMG